MSEPEFKALSLKDWTHIHFHTQLYPHPCQVPAASGAGLKVPGLTPPPILLRSVQAGSA